MFELLSKTTRRQGSSRIPADAPYLFSRLHVGSKSEMPCLFAWALAISLYLPTGAQPAPTLLNVSYDVSREFYEDFNKQFVA